MSLLLSDSARNAHVFAWERRHLARSQQARGQLAALRALVPAIEARSPKVLIGVPGDDVHVVANRLTERLLRAIGYRVVNLGVMAREDDFVRACDTGDPDAIIISSINGHALGNCGGLPARLAAAGFDVPLYLGGNLVVGNQPWETVHQRFIDLGFRAVFAPWQSLPEGMVPISTEVLARRAPLRGIDVGGTALLGRVWDAYTQLATS